MAGPYVRPPHRQQAAPPGGQLGFEHLGASERPPARAPLDQRRREHARELAGHVQRTHSADPSRERALSAIRRELLYFVRCLGVGRQFQAVDFTARLDELGLRPDPRVLDMRVVGGLVKHLESVGIIRAVGTQPTGSAKYHSTTRPVYEVVVLDFTRVHWQEVRSR